MRPTATRNLMQKLHIPVGLVLVCLSQASHGKDFSLRIWCEHGVQNSGTENTITIKAFNTNGKIGETTTRMTETACAAAKALTLVNGPPPEISLPVDVNGDGRNDDPDFFDLYLLNKITIETNGDDAALIRKVTFSIKGRDYEAMPRSSNAGKGYCLSKDRNDSFGSAQALTCLPCWRITPPGGSVGLNFAACTR